MKIKRARESFCYWSPDGAPHDVPAGTLIDADKTSWYVGREHLFEDADVYVDQQTSRAQGHKAPEAATASPGEARAVQVVASPEQKPETPVEPKPAATSRFRPPTKDKEDK